MKNEPRPFSAFLLDVLRDDPEWASFVSSLRPTMPLNRAVYEYLQFVKRRVGLTPEESEATRRLLALVEERGYSSIDEMAEAAIPSEDAGRVARHDALRMNPATAKAAGNPG